MLWRIIEITVNNDHTNETVCNFGVHDLLYMALLLLFNSSDYILPLDNRERGNTASIGLMQDDFFSHFLILNLSPKK